MTVRAVLRNRLDAGLRQLGRVPATVPALLIVWAACAAWLANGHGTAQTQGLRQATLYARLLDDHASRTFAAVGMTLDATAVLIGELPQSAPVLSAAQADAAAVLLAQHIAGQPVIHSLSMLREDGTIEAASQPGDRGSRVPAPLLSRLLAQARHEAPPLLQAGRDLAQASVAAASAAPHRMVLVARFAPVGGPRRLIVAALNPDFFANQYDLLLDDPHWHAALATIDGELLAATSQSTPQPGESIAAASPAFGPEAAEHGSAVGRGLSGEHALGAWRGVGHLPLVVLADMSSEHALAEWRRDARKVLLAGMATSLMIGGLGVVSRRHRLERDEAAAERQAAMRQLREQYEMTEQLIDAIPVPVFLTDLGANLLLANRAWVASCGLDAEPGPGDATTAVHARVESMLGLGAAQVAAGEEARWPLDLPHASGVRETVLTKVALRHGDGAVRGVIGTLIDISEYKQAERATERALKAAQASNQARSEFVANVSHELRTPLQSIIGFAELGLARAGEQPRLQLMFQRIEGAGHRMLALVEDLLDVSRMGSAVGSVLPRPDSVPAAVNAVVDELRPLAAGRRLRLTVTPETAQADAPAWVDAVRYQQVVRNVVANAMRFAPPDSSIDIDVAIGAGTATTTVRDHGPGIPEAELEAIFEPFVQSSRTKDGSGGTGLGLAICRQIMQAHRGHIEAANHASGGAVFRFGVPLVAAPATEPAENEPTC